MKKNVSFVLLVLLICFSCKKEVGIAGPSGPPGSPGISGIPADTGSISGSLSLYDEFSWPVPDSSGVTVTISSGSLQRSTLTDFSGHYIFYGMETGTYNLSYQKTGFGTMKVFGISHAPGGPLPSTVPDVFLLQKPVKTAVSHIGGLDGNPDIRIGIYLDTSSVSYQPFYGNLVLLIGKNPDINLSNYLVMHSENIGTDGLGGYVDYIDRSSLAGLFNPGDSIYVTACTYNRYIHRLKDPDTFFDLGSSAYYVDPGNGNYVYPNLSAAPEILRFAY